YDHNPTTGIHFLVFGITIPYVNGTPVDERPTLPDPQIDVSQGDHGIKMEIKHHNYVVNLKWDIRICIDPNTSPWTIEDQKVAQLLRTIAKKTGAQIPQAAYQLSRARIVPQPDYATFARRVYCHEFQHYLDFSYLADLIFLPWLNWIDAMTGAG